MTSGQVLRVTFAKIEETSVSKNSPLQDFIRDLTSIDNKISWRQRMEVKPYLTGKGKLFPNLSWVLGEGSTTA